MAGTLYITGDEATDALLNTNANALLIGMLLDQRARKKPVLAPFFGRPARCDRSAGVLMKRLGAPVLLVACYQTERPLYFRAHFSGCILPEEVREATPEEISGRINAAFEEIGDEGLADAMRAHVALWMAQRSDGGA